jgi:hypothetical protein
MADELEENAGAAPATIEEQEKQEANTDDSNETPPADIVAYNELRSCADVFRMHAEGVLDIQPEFQREFVWKGIAQTRFIDSLIKQLPIPSMCFAYDYKQNKWIVIDGLQRISTIIRFLEGDKRWKLSSLPDIDQHLSGANAADIKAGKRPELKNFYARVQNQTLPVNVLRCDFKKKRHNEYLFTIFHRLNSGGSKLNNQEIRNCIYSGPFNDLLRSLDKLPEWRTINHMKDDGDQRFIKQEWILRLFAFLEDGDKYKGSVSKFLNDFMFENRDGQAKTLDARRDLFERVVKVLGHKIFDDKQPNRMPGTVLEAIMVGIARNLPKCEAANADDLKKQFQMMLDDESISEASLAEGLSKPDKVTARFQAATKIFAGG